MSLLTTTHQTNLQAKLEELERRNQSLEAEIERLRVYKDYAYTDALTEIPNRRFYYERLLQEVARARRGAHPLTLALVDLDFFKQINEQVGHRGGDQVLKFFSQFLRVNLRQVNEQRTKTNRVMIAFLNHPNFGWGVRAEEMLLAEELKFFEVFNGHPGVRNYGDPQHAS